MLILISSAKTMQPSVAKAAFPATVGCSSRRKAAWQQTVANAGELAVPPFDAEAQYILRQLAAYSAEELASMLRLTPRMAHDARMRLTYAVSPQSMPLPALCAYDGVVFRHIDVAHFSVADWQYAARHLCIASSCYGLLGPADAVKPYRSEYDVELPAIGCSLGRFWRDRLTDYLIGRVAESGGVLLDLAAHDVRQSLHWDRICRQVRVITPDFKLLQDDSLRTVVVYLKQARGAMVRHIIKERIDTPEALQMLTVDGFEFSPERSGESDYCYIMRV